MSALFVSGNIRLHSGMQSDWKIECDALDEHDWMTLAHLIAERVMFSYVEGVPNGGICLATCLQPYQSAEGPLLIVDDVCTTGASLERQRGGRDAVGYVVFARGGLPAWARALFTLDAHEEG